MRELHLGPSWFLLVLLALANPFAGFSLQLAAAFSFPSGHNRHHRVASQYQVIPVSSSRLFGVAKSNVEETKEYSSTTSIIRSVDDCIGSGSYGTVHFLQVVNDDKDEEPPQWLIGKRPWTESELQEQEASASSSSKSKSIGKEQQGSTTKPKDFKERAARCLYYWQVEEHCFSKLPSHPQLPPYYGTLANSSSSNGNNNKKKQKGQEEWMIFGLVGTPENGASRPKPAPSLAELMKRDLEDLKLQKEQSDSSSSAWESPPHFLRNIGEAMKCSTDGETLDKTLDSLLNVLALIHSYQIVHRDIKPSNLLVHDGALLLLDFGSAADLEPVKSGGVTSFLGGGTRYWGMEDGNRVAVSPIYCAPEVFVDIHNAPLAFDLFSSVLLFCQLLFGYLEERVDAGFHQQLQDAEWDLNAWLYNELASKLRPDGLERALEYLGERPGLWSLLQHMLEANPTRRPTAEKAQARLAKVLEEKSINLKNDDYDKRATLEERDGAFFAMVLDAMEACELPSVSRPLHFVATFSRNKPLGLVFAEADAEDSGLDDDSEDSFLWSEATKDALPGEVFVKEIVPGGQADELGIFEIGDRLQGIGELTFSTGGFEKAVEMLQDQPRSTRNVILHFDRLRVRENEAIAMLPTTQTAIEIVDQGVWSTMGRRQTQEDAFVLHEIHDTKDRSVLIMGVMDGHGGTAASTKVSTELPTVLRNQVVFNRLPLEQALLDSWNMICQSYQQQCADEEQCIADYDSREGVLTANTGSEDLIAGTTASVMALDETNGVLVVLNCGDSRSMVVTVDGKVQFATQDHTPQTEEERLMQGIAAGLDYSLPKCKFSKWYISTGMYEYAVGRSLEGPYVTSKGIVSDADISKTLVGPGEILMSATDGLWEVMDSEEVASILHRMKQQGLHARDAARSLCSMAVKKGTTDNVSVVVVYV